MRWVPQSSAGRWCVLRLSTPSRRESYKTESGQHAYRIYSSSTSLPNTWRIRRAIWSLTMTRTWHFYGSSVRLYSWCIHGYRVPLYSRCMNAQAVPFIYNVLIDYTYCMCCRYCGIAETLQVILLSTRYSCTVGTSRLYQPLHYE